MMQQHTRSFLFLVLGLILVGCAGESPGEVWKSFSREVEAGQLDQAMYYLSSSVRGTIPEEKLRAGLQESTKEASEKGGIEQLEVLEESIQGQTAEVRIRVVFGNGETETGTIPLVREDGRWKLALEK